MELALSPVVTIVWIVNYILFSIAILVAVLVFRDARKHNMLILEALVWAAVSLFTFPIGTLIYIFFGRNKNGRSPVSR